MKYFYWCLPMDTVKEYSVSKVQCNLPIEFFC